MDSPYVWSHVGKDAVGWSVSVSVECGAPRSETGECWVSIYKRFRTRTAARKERAGMEARVRDAMRVLLEVTADEVAHA